MARIFEDVRAGDSLLLAPSKDKDGRLAKPSQGLAKLVLTLLETLRQLMEKQAIRRMEDGSLSDDQVESLGLTLMQLREKIREIALLFNLKEDELTLGLEPLGELVDPIARPRSAMTLVDLLDRLIEKGVLVAGDLGISIADVELISVQLRLLVSAVKKTSNRGRRKLPGRTRKKRVREIKVLEQRKELAPLLVPIKRK